MIAPMSLDPAHAPADPAAGPDAGPEDRDSATRGEAATPHAESASSGIPSRRRLDFAVPILLALLAFATWSGALRCGFVWDDEYFIVRNPSIRSWAQAPRYFLDIETMAGDGRARQFLVFRPIRNLSYLLDYKIAGLAPAWWHAHNLALHFANALLLLAVARRAGPSSDDDVRSSSIRSRRDAGASFAAIVFLVHPAQSEVVAWVKCRDDLLMVFFSLLTFLSWLRARAPDRPVTSILPVVAFTALACLSKIQAVALPAILLAHELILGRPREGRLRAAATVGASVAGAFAVVAWRHFFLGRTSQIDALSALDAGGRDFSALATMARAWGRYLRILLTGGPLMADYSGMEGSERLLDPRALRSAVALVVVGFAAFACRRRLPAVAFGVAWIALGLAPVSNVVPTMQFMAERFLYLAMPGFALVAGALYSAAAVRVRGPARVVAAVGAVALVGSMSLAASRRLNDWKTGEALIDSMLRDAPDAYRPLHNRLIHLMNSGANEDAMPLARRLHDLVVRDERQPLRRRAFAERDLGATLLADGRTTEALERLDAAIALDPGFALPRMDRGTHAGRSGRDEEALRWFEEAVRIEPSNTTAHRNRGIALRALGRLDEAEATLRRAIACGPPDSGAHLELASLLWSRGRLDEAETVYREALAAWPGDPVAVKWLRNLEARRAGRSPVAP